MMVNIDGLQSKIKRWQMDQTPTEGSSVNMSPELGVVSELQLTICHAHNQSG